MGDRTAKLKFAGACAAVVAGGALATAVATAQGPGDYQPPTSTTTLPAPPDGRVEFRAEAKAGPLGAYIKVKVHCDERCWVSGRGRVRLTKIPGARKGSAGFRTGRDRGSLPGAGDLTLKMKVPKYARRVTRSEEYKGRASAKVVVSAKDAAGNSDRNELRMKFDKRR
jgi:hypothetical protein